MIYYTSFRFLTFFLFLFKCGVFTIFYGRYSCRDIFLFRVGFYFFFIFFFYFFFVRRFFMELFHFINITFFINIEIFRRIVRIVYSVIFIADARYYTCDPICCHQSVASRYFSGIFIDIIILFIFFD